MKLTSISFILFFCFLCENVFSQDQHRPNIIVMYFDDHTAQSIGAYRDALNYGLKLDHTPTPNIDRLAESGMRFDNAFVTNSICVPSRAVMLSGMHSHMTGVVTNMESMPVDLKTFPVILQQNGYQTAMIGKWHLKTEPQGFDYYEVLYGQGPYYNPTMRTPNGDVEYHGHTTGIITDIALKADPEQLNSVYGDPGYAEVQQELKTKLDELQEKYSDESWSYITPGVPFHGVDQ